MLKYDLHMHTALRHAGYSTSDLEEIKRRMNAEPAYLSGLRDEFAKAALQGYLASAAPDLEPIEFASTIAADCYALADAMIAARGKGGTP